MKKNIITAKSAVDLIAAYCTRHNIGITVRSMANIELIHPIYNDDGEQVGVSPRTENIDNALSMAAPSACLCSDYTLVFTTDAGGTTAETHAYSRMKVALAEAKTIMNKKGGAGSIEIWRGDDLFVTLARPSKLVHWVVTYL